MKLFPPLKEISITEIEGLRIGNAQDLNAMTGVTVLRFDEGAKAGCDISGGGPASRETPLTSPVTADNPINAIVLSGGSAFGLAASDGVMRYLEEHGIGYDTGFAKVPLVCQSCIMTWGSAGQMCGRMLPWDMRHVKMRKRTSLKAVSSVLEPEPVLERSADGNMPQKQVLEFMLSAQEA